MTDDSPPHDDSVTRVAPPPTVPTGESTESQDFTENLPARPDSATPVLVETESSDGPRRWYLGIAEAICWFMGTLFVHLTAGVVIVIALVVIRMIQTGSLRPDVEDPQSMLIITAGEMICFVLISMLAVSVRYWGRTFNEINLGWPEPKHVLIVACGTLPLSWCVSAWSIPIQHVWNQIKASYPQLDLIDNMNTIKLVQEISESTPLPIMILVVAVLPAIGEELIFRFAIGRVLIAQIGIWGAILLTSFLFGCVHVHPVHALSVIPLGLAMHLIYFWTRSFWMPMLLHFLNNSWALLTLKMAAGDPLGEGVQLSWWEGIEVVIAAVTVTALTIALWQSRVRFIQADGREWGSSRFPLRVPPSPSIRRQSAPMNSTCWYAAIVCAVICHAMAAFSIVRPVIEGNQ